MTKEICVSHLRAHAPGMRRFEAGQMVTVGVGAGEFSTKVIGTDDPTNDKIGFIWEE